MKTQKRRIILKTTKELITRRTISKIFQEIDKASFWSDFDDYEIDKIELGLKKVRQKMENTA